MAKRIYVIAMKEESALVPSDEEFIITGEGALNVIEALKNIPRDTPLFNVGYVGSNNLEIGSVVMVGNVYLYHPSVSYEEPEYFLGGNIPCFTSCDFVTHTEIKETCVFDMELAFILAMGFTDVKAKKIVSDNLSKSEFDMVLV